MCDVICESANICDNKNCRFKMPHSVFVHTSLKCDYMGVISKQISVTKFMVWNEKYNNDNIICEAYNECGNKSCDPNKPFTKLTCSLYHTLMLEQDRKNKTI